VSDDPEPAEASRARLPALSLAAAATAAAASGGGGAARRPDLSASERRATHDSRTTRAPGQRDVATEPDSAPSGITTSVT